MFLALLLKFIYSNIFFGLELNFQSDKNYHFVMGVLFVLISQNRNLTRHRISFQVRNGFGPVPGLCPVPDLEPYSTGTVKLHRVLRYCREHVNSPSWTIGVFCAGKYTGVELTSDHLLFNTRLVFRRVTNAEGLSVHRVDGVPENCNDYLLRHRNIIWDKRTTVFIGQEDSQSATKLRKMEAPSFDQQAGPLASLPLHTGSDVPNRSNFGKLNSDHRHVPTKLRADVAMRRHSEGLAHTRIKEQPILVVNSRPPLSRISTSERVNNHMDTFVHGFLFLVPFAIALLAYAFTR